MKIVDHEIGPGHPVFLQAEVGVTMMGDVKRAFALVEAAAHAGMDAFKAIVTDPDKIMSRKDVPYSYERIQTISSHPAWGARKVIQEARPIYDLLAEVRFTFDEWRQIRDACHARGLIFYATTDYLEGVDLLEALDVPVHKLSAWDIGYRPLIARMVETKKPVIWDVGTATVEEYGEVLGLVREHLPVNAPHPTDAGDWYLGRPLDEAWGSWGFSSPGRKPWPDFVALGVGACLIEKRLTLRRDEARGHHHAISLEPDELRDWIRQIRYAEAALREDPWGGSAEAWAERRKWDRDPVTGLRS